MEKEQFLNEKVFYGLTNLNDGFDSPSIKYFSAEDFRIVLERVENLGLGVLGIEPWVNGEFYDVSVFEDYVEHCTEPAWYKKAFNEFLERNIELQYAASFFLPKPGNK